MSLLLANTITADMGLIPGLAFVGPAIGLPLSVLASVIERPFYTRGGIASHAIWYSLQANLVSLGLGFALLLVFGLIASAVGLGASDDAFFLVWPILAVFLSAVIERTYIAKQSSSKNLSWRWSAAGNIVSAAVCVGILFCIAPLREHYPRLAVMLRPYASVLEVISGIGSGVAFGVAFLVTGFRAARAIKPPA